MIIDPRNQGGGSTGSTVQNYQIVGALSAVTSPTEGMKAYVTTTHTPYIYTSNSEWRVDDFSFVIDGWTQSDWLEFYSYFSGLTYDEKYKVNLLVGSDSNLGNYIGLKLFNQNGTNFTFQGSDTVDDNNNNGRFTPNRLEKIKLDSGGTITKTTQRFSNVVYVNVDNTSHSITFGNCSALNLNRSLVADGYEVTAYLKSGSTTIATTSIKGSSIMSGSTRVNKLLMDWEFETTSVHAEYSIDSSNSITLLSWTETPVTTFRLGSTTLTEAQLQSLIALIPTT